MVLVSMLFSLVWSSQSGWRDDVSPSGWMQARGTVTPHTPFGSFSSPSPHGLQGSRGPQGQSLVTFLRQRAREGSGILSRRCHASERCSRSPLLSRLLKSSPSSASPAGFWSEPVTLLSHPSRVPILASVVLHANMLLGPLENFYLFPPNTVLERQLRPAVFKLRLQQVWAGQIMTGPISAHVRGGRGGATARIQEAAAHLSATVLPE